MSYCIDGHELDMLFSMYSLVVVISTVIIIIIIIIMLLLFLLLLKIHTAIDGMEGGYFIACRQQQVLVCFCRPQQCTSLDNNGDAQSLMVLRLSISGIDTGTLATTGTTFVLTLHIFPTSLERSWYFSSLSSSFFSHPNIFRNCCAYN